MKTRIIQSAWIFSLFCCLASAQNASPLWRKYFAASHNAQDAEPWKISKNLIAIIPSEKGLLWKKGSPDRPMVKVVSWVEYASSADAKLYSVGPMTAAPNYDDNTLIWVTAIPELKTFCTNYRRISHGSPLILRIQQRLGMPPIQAAKSRFVEFWVRPNDLIRPSPDPEVTDHEAGLNFPLSNELIKINNTYIAWFLEHKRTIYTRSIPGTWTRLGYTYDWGNPNHPIGESEFIIRPGAQIEVDSIKSTNDYCP